MALEEVALICFSLVTMVAVVCLAYFKSEENKEKMRQNGITQRAQMKVGMPGDNMPASPSGEWWVPLATELLKNPAIQDMIMKKVAPTLTGVKTGE